MFVAGFFFFFPSIRFSASPAANTISSFNEVVVRTQTGNKEIFFSRSVFLFKTPMSKLEKELVLLKETKFWA